MTWIFRPKPIFCALGFVVIAAVLPAQVITTVAGTQWAFPDVNVPAVGAPLSGDIYSIGTDSKGNIIICDTGNSLVFSVNQAGVLTAIAGNGPEAIPVTEALPPRPRSTIPTTLPTIRPGTSTSPISRIGRSARSLLPA